MKAIKSKVLIFLFITTLLLPFFLPRKVEGKDKVGWPNCPAIQAEAALVMDLNTGTVLVETNSTEKAYPASITKIMTALIALEHAKDLDEMVYFPAEAIEKTNRDSSSIGMLPGEEISLRDCLYALMLASANEVANAIAIHTSGSIEAFVELMNEKARELGCVNTHFNNPNGLHDPLHYTCALDMAKIGKEALKFDEFRKIAGTRTYVINETNLMKEKRPIANHHQMINPAKFPQYAYEYCYAGKTGYTNEAGMTLVSFAKKGSMNLVCVVLKAESREAQFGGTAKLLNYSFKRFRMEQAEKIKLAYEKSDFFEALKTKDAAAKLYIPATSMLAIPKKCDINSITAELTFESPEKLSVGENQVGEVSYHYNGKEIGRYPLLYRSEETIMFKDPEPEKGEEKTEKKEGRKATEKELLLYKISIGVGGFIIFATLFGILLYFRNKKRKRRSYIHRSLRRISKRRNRLR